jgi:hypothetical protein
MAESAWLALLAPGHALSARADRQIPIASIGGWGSRAW